MEAKIKKTKEAGRTFLEFLVTISISGTLLAMFLPTIVSQGSNLNQRLSTKKLELKEAKFQSILRNIVENDEQIFSLNQVSIENEKLTVILPTISIRKKITTKRGNYLRACGESSLSKAAKGWAALSVDGVSFFKFHSENYQTQGYCISGTIEAVKTPGYSADNLEQDGVIIGIKDIVEIGLDTNRSVYQKSLLTKSKQKLFEEFEILKFEASASRAIKVTAKLPNGGLKIFYLANRPKSASHLELLL